MYRRQDPAQSSIHLITVSFPAFFTPMRFFILKDTISLAGAKVACSGLNKMFPGLSCSRYYVVYWQSSNVPN